MQHFTRSRYYSKLIDSYSPPLCFPSLGGVPTKISTFVTAPRVGLEGHIDCIRDPDLKKRALSLPSLAAARWAPSTSTKYLGGWEKWESWCRMHPESPARPAVAFYICLYVNDLVLSKCKYGALNTAAASIRWGHLSWGLDNPMDNQFVAIVLEGAKRTVGKPPSQQKEPMTVEMAKQVTELFGRGSNLLEHRSVVICLLGFSGFLRISELIEIQIKHLKFFDSHLEITIPKAKNDQEREGHIVHIARTFSEHCPVQWVGNYLAETGLGDEDENYLICRLAKTSRGHNAHGNRPLCDSTVREIFNRDIAPICEKLEPGSYCLHSLRSGGASAAINNGVSERLIGKHGRWKSGFSRDRYLKDNKKQRLGVTVKLGL